MLHNPFFRIVVALMSAVLLGGLPATVAAGGSSSAARERRDAQVAATFAAASRSTPCWYQIPGFLRLVDLNLVQEVVVGNAYGGYQSVTFMMPLHKVEFTLPATQAAKLFSELMARTQACASPN